MTSTDPISASAFTEVEIAHTGLTLVAELEASLADSQKALLALDLAGIERGTREQALLGRNLEALVLRTRRIVTVELARGKERPLAPPSPTPEELSGLRAAANGVLQSIRVQAALLTRAQRALRIRAHRVAGIGATYGPFPAPDRGLSLWAGRE
jgi:hypothetical protein